MSGGFNPVSLVSQVALGAMTGGASLYLQLAMQFTSQLGSQLIQSLGQQMGLPQTTIDLAQTAFAGSSGSFQATQGFEGLNFQGQATSLDDSIAQLGEAFGASPQAIGDAQRDANDSLNQIVTDLAESKEAKEARYSGRGGSWLRAMAEVLGKQLDDLAHEMQDLAGKVDKNDPSTTTEFTVVSQMFSMVMNATNTAIKTIGEALAGTARKQ